MGGVPGGATLVHVNALLTRFHKLVSVGWTTTWYSGSNRVVIRWHASEERFSKASDGLREWAPAVWAWTAGCVAPLPEQIIDTLGLAAATTNTQDIDQDREQPWFC